MIGKTLIRSSGSQVVVENSEGLRVRCGLGADAVCSVTVSGWYFGKTGGLLGVYDNEPANDLMTPQRQVEEDPEVFANSWAVGRCSQARETGQMENTIREVSRREKAVSSSLPLAPVPSGDRVRTELLQVPLPVSVLRPPPVLPDRGRLPLLAALPLRVALLPLRPREVVRGGYLLGGGCLRGAVQTERGGALRSSCLRLMHG